VSEPKNNMEALLKDIRAQGKSYFGHTKIDNKAFEEIQLIFDVEILWYQKELEQSKTMIDAQADQIEAMKVKHEKELKQVKAEKERMILAVRKHFKANCNLDRYPNYNQDDVDLWRFFKMEEEV
jgi:hypothetical protein